MAVITPNTDLYLLKVPLEMNDINQLDFDNATAQYNYFNSLPKITVDDFTYQRKDNSIRFPASYDEIITYNYCMYKNTEYSDKWFYAFITNMQYVNDNVTLITIKSDVWQCWQFDLRYKPCLIEREHTNDDTIGLNILPESLELGDMVTNGEIINFGEANDYCTIIEVSQVQNEGDGSSLSYTWSDGSASRTVTPTLNGILRGTTPLAIGDLSTDPPLTCNSVSDVRQLYDFAGLGSSIINMYMLPMNFITSYHTLNLTAHRDGGSTVSILNIAVPDKTTNTINLGSAFFNRPTSVDGYIPKNKKLLTYPFCYFNISNNAGTSLPYRYEDFSSDISFNTEATFGPSGNTKATPVNYKNITSQENGIDYSISGPKYPICSWNSDSYTNWLTQNAVNLNTKWRTTAVSAVGDIAGGALIGNPILGTIAGVKTLLATAREQNLAKTQANMTPDQVHGNLNAGDYLWAKYRSPFTYLPMSIKAQYARCIDDYFSMFGYATNRVKLPNVKGRRRWNYVKTVGCYIEADIPQEDLAEIKNMFDSGITIWHNPAYFADYSQNNDII